MDLILNLYLYIFIYGGDPNSGKNLSDSYTEDILVHRSTIVSNQGCGSGSGCFERKFGSGSGFTLWSNPYSPTRFADPDPGLPWSDLFSRLKLGSGIGFTLWSDPYSPVRVVDPDPVFFSYLGRIYFELKPWSVSGFTSWLDTPI